MSVYLKEVLNRRQKTNELTAEHHCNRDVSRRFIQSQLRPRVHHILRSMV